MDIVDVMIRSVVSVSPDTSLHKAARLMIDGGFSGLPVVDGGSLVGIVSEADFVSRDGSQSWMSRVIHGEDEAPLQEVDLVKEIMTSPAVTVADTATVHEAARVMTRKGLKRLPVVDRYGELVGIVTRRDLIRAYVRSDEEIAGEVRTLLDVLPTPLSSVEVNVVDGIVTLSGDIGTSTEAHALCRMAKGVEGVGRVVNELDWEVTSELGESTWAEYGLHGETTDS